MTAIEVGDGWAEVEGRSKKEKRKKERKKAEDKEEESNAGSHRLKTDRQTHTHTQKLEYFHP